jgi:glucosamine--fructose-6-phosphate aminotransferase (isomerizing)
MAASYFNDIFDQPEALQNTLDGLATTSSPDLQRLLAKLSSGEYQRLVLTGMGSSYTAQLPFWLRCLQQGMPVHLIETSELIHYAHGLIGPRTLVVAVSQSGLSAEIMRLLELTRGLAPVIGVTNTPDSPLAQQAAAVVMTQAGDETTVSCKTYLATLAAMEWLGDQILGDTHLSHFKQLSDTPRLVAGYLSNWQAYISQLVERFAPIRNLYLVGRGPSLATVGTGALILKESAHFAAEGLSSATFRHGPMEMAAPHVFVLVFQGLSQTAGLNERLLGDVLARGGQAEAVRMANEPGVFNLPPAPDAALTILEMLPVQLVSLALAQIQGFEAGRFSHATKVTITE